MMNTETKLLVVAGILYLLYKSSRVIQTDSPIIDSGDGLIDINRLPPVVDTKLYSQAWSRATNQPYYDGSITDGDLFT